MKIDAFANPTDPPKLSFKYSTVAPDGKNVYATTAAKPDWVYGVKGDGQHDGRVEKGDGNHIYSWKRDEYGTLTDREDLILDPIEYVDANTAEPLMSPDGKFLYLVVNSKPLY